MAKLSNIKNKENRLELKNKLRRNIKLDTILQIIQICMLAAILYRIN